LALVSGILTLAGAATAHSGKNGGYGRRIRETTRDGLPNLQSPVAFIVEWPSGRVVLERDADVVRPVASLSKLMAALVIVDECRLPADKQQEVTREAREAASLTGGNRFSKLRVGWTYRVDDLLHAAMLKSDNKALPALAEACGLDAAGLGRKMTARAKAMGLTHTAFVEPDGLSEGNVSTAREMAQILKAAVANPTLTTIMAKSAWTITGHKGQRVETVKLKNTDQLVSRDVLDAAYGKTGFTNLARYCLAATAKLPAGAGAPNAGATSIGMVFLGAEGRNTRFGDFMRMYKWLTTPAMAKARETHGETIRLASVLNPGAEPAATQAAAQAQAPMLAAGFPSTTTTAAPASDTGTVNAAALGSAAKTAATPEAAPAPKGFFARLVGLFSGAQGG
jgi:D-alanyl-D-alanine endopeptidase (penicillin-binding protein 7)